MAKKKKPAPMTKTDENRHAQKHSRFHQFVKAPWHFLALGLVTSSLVHTYLQRGSSPLLVGGAIAFVFLAAFLVYARLHDRQLSSKPDEPTRLTTTRNIGTEGETTSTGNWLRLDFWTVLIPVLSVMTMRFARNHGWLGTNAPERTNWILVLGIVFIAGICRLWWRDRQEKRLQAKKESLGRDK